MKVLITGSNGQLGNELRLRSHDIHADEVEFVDIDELDITDAAAVEAMLKSGEYTHLVNCAAYTNVDKAEADHSSCYSVNSDALTVIGKLASAYGVKVIHISTDYVFNGQGYKPYNESDKADPISVYGLTKRNGEKALLAFCDDAIIVRTSWLYSSTGKNFVKTMLSIAKAATQIRVVSDQIGSPTYAGDLADAIVSILNAKKWVPGIFHFSNEGVCSWYDFAKAIFRLAGVERDVVPVTTDEYPTAARRPHYSVLDKSKIKKIYGLVIPHWEESLHKCVDILCNDTEL